MSPDDVKRLRRDLKCTAKELASTLGVDQKTIFSWEKGDLFPTKQYVDKMNALLEKGAVRLDATKQKDDAMSILSDPAVWEVVRKLLTHKKLRDDVIRLAKDYDDPA